MIASLRKLCFCVAAAVDWELWADLVWQPNDHKKTVCRQRHLCCCQPVSWVRHSGPAGGWVLGGVGCVDDEHRQVSRHGLYCLLVFYLFSNISCFYIEIPNSCPHEHLYNINSQGDNSANLLDIPLPGLGTDRVSGCNLLDIISSWLPGSNWVQTSPVTRHTQ